MLDIGIPEQVILGLSDEEKQNKLPQHDFPVAKVCQTPSSFRVMTWKTEIINGEEKLIKEIDQSMVTIRPKYYIGSTRLCLGRGSP